MKPPLYYILSACLLAGIASCDESNPENNSEIELAKSQVQITYPYIVFANYEDAYHDAEALHQAAHDFVDNPTDVNFTNVKNLWLAARESYGTTEAFRFANGPIDDEDGPEGALNAWPLDENYIDYVAGDNASGIINNPADFPIIDAQTLLAQNEVGGETNISVGYHAIEFLLWGQDLTNPSALLPGQRPYTDYVVGGTAANQARRAAYLLACADLLVADLKSVMDDWNPDITGNYRATFLALTPDQALTNILTGIGVLSKSELPGERIYTAYDHRDQEDEHSCFSDNTHRDIRLNTLGIKNVYMASYTRTDGTFVTGKSLHSLMALVNAELAADVNAKITLSMEKVEATGTPFDFAISNDAQRPAILESVTTLQTMGDKFAQVGTALGLSINTSLP